MKKLTILVDADSVMENLSEAWVKYLNNKYGTDVKYEDVTEWDMTEAFPELTREQVYGAELEPQLYELVEPLKDAPLYLKKLMDDGHVIYVVTSTPYQIIAEKTEQVLLEYFPFLTWKNFIITSYKQMIKGEVLIDDGIHNLVGGEYEKLLMDAPYNRSIDAAAEGIDRVFGWAEIYEKICALAGDDERLIRPADLSDAARIAEIEVTNYRLNFYPIFKDDEYYFQTLTAESMAAEIRKSGSYKHTFVYDDGAVKGFVRINGTEIEKLFVEPVLQGNSIGARLLEFAVKEKKADHLWALEKNVRAINFYERMGFCQSGEKKYEEDTTEYLVKMEYRGEKI